MCTCMCVLCSHVQAGDCKRPMSSFGLYCSPLHFWVTGSVAEPGAGHFSCISWLGGSWDLSVFLHPDTDLPGLRLKALTAMPGFYMKGEDPNSGLCASVAETLPMQPSP